MLRNKFVLLCVGLAAVGVLLFNLSFFSRSSSGSGKARSAPPPVTLTTTTPPKAGYFVLHGVHVSVGEGDASWLRGRPRQGSVRDPFGEAPSPPTLQERREVPAAEPLPALRVSAIVISDVRRVAIINQEAFTVGDSIGEERVLEIKHDRVLVGKGGQRREILVE